jgi:hypothetical protein
VRDQIVGPGRIGRRCNGLVKRAELHDADGTRPSEFVAVMAGKW